MPKPVQPPIRRLAILGGESTGKSTLAEMLAETLNTVHVEEYGRTIWQQRGGAFRFTDMLHIAQSQLQLERDLMDSARDWLICDTTPLSTLFYSQELFGKVDPLLRNLAETRYDFYLLCADDFAFVQDGTRQDAAFRAMQNRWYERHLQRRHCLWQWVEGSVRARLEQALELISALHSV
jgi:NadR type nicotinamide-nucleotide adenylyltransferase